MYIELVSDFRHPGGPVGVDVNWPEYEIHDQEYINIDKSMGSHSVHQFLGAKEIHFWRKVMSEHMGMRRKDDSSMCVHGYANQHTPSVTPLLLMLLAFYFTQL